MQPSRWLHHQMHILDSLQLRLNTINLISFVIKVLHSGWKSIWAIKKKYQKNGAINLTNEECNYDT